MESEGLGFDPQHLKATFDPGLYKNIKNIPIHSVPIMKKIPRDSVKDFFLFQQTNSCPQKILKM